MIRLIDTHPGNGRWTGGQYGESRLLVPAGQRWRVQHETTADLPYCPGCGKYLGPSDLRHRCRPEYISHRELVDLAGPEAVARGRDGQTIVVDITGHEQRPCQWGGGCTVCWPCGHGGCATYPWEAV